MYFNVSVLVASLAVLFCSNAGVLATPLATKPQQEQQQIQKRGWLPYGITLGEFIASTAVGVGLGGSIVQLMKLNKQKKPSNDWDDEYSEDSVVE